MKLIPRVSAKSSWRWASASLFWVPKVMVPRQTLETLSSLWPSVLYFIGKIPILCAGALFYGANIAKQTDPSSPYACATPARPRIQRPRRDPGSSADICAVARRFARCAQRTALRAELLFRPLARRIPRSLSERDAQGAAAGVHPRRLLALARQAGL